MKPPGRFDHWSEAHCVLRVGQYALLVGYFEGIDSQRGIAWRCADSLSLRQFLGLALEEHSPDHSTLSLNRRRLPPEVFEEFFRFVLQIAAEKKLLSGKTVGVDSTTLEADAAMKSIVRRDTGENRGAMPGAVSRILIRSDCLEPCVPVSRLADS